MSRRESLALAGAAPTDEQWEAIVRRRGPEPGWLLIVTSTGIVCRPGCPARTPGRDRVRIVASLRQALEAGARPCLRCHPELADGVAPAPPESEAEAVTRAIERLSTALKSGDDTPTDMELARTAGLSERRLREAFRSALGVTPREFVRARRAGRLRAHLDGRSSVLEAIFEAGYGSSSSAYEAAAAELGMPPGRYRDGGAGETIRWTAAPIPGGVALVAATERGLCAVRLGDGRGAEQSLEAELRAEYPRATISRDDSGLAEMATLVADLAAGRPRSEVSGLPLDIHATAFRLRVWEALRRIPWGETRSYGQVAEAVGAPRAARAVGAACGANPVAIVVPCHRVVAADGSLHGYAYGLARKRQLLDAERARGGR